MAYLLQDLKETLVLVVKLLARLQYIPAFTGNLYLVPYIEIRDILVYIDIPLFLVLGLLDSLLAPLKSLFYTGSDVLSTFPAKL